jgi:predicted ATPase
MAIRVNKLLSELNIGLATFESMLNTLGYKEDVLTPNSKIPEDIAILVKNYFSEGADFFKLVKAVADRGVYGSKVDSTPLLKVVGRIDLDELNTTKRVKEQKSTRFNDNILNTPELVYNEKPTFWICELAMLSPEKEVNSIEIGAFDDAGGLPLYSLLIGTNGAGKSSMMKEIVDFFIDLHSCVNDSEPKLTGANKGRLKGIRYHIDGMEIGIVRIEKGFAAIVDGHFRNLKEIRLPSVVACHFGAFDKLPTQTVNGSSQTRYDVPCYKYVGAHVNGSMISSSAIAFRLLFALNEKMNDRQRGNIRSILDFIGYDHRISLSYSLVLKAKKDGSAKNNIVKRVENDREYSRLNSKEKNEIITQLYNFYRSKTTTGNARHDYDVDFDSSSTSGGATAELQYIYKLKQCDLVSSTNVIFHKQGSDITSEELSSGEFAMLSTVLSISAAASDPHTLVLLDEPELSLHPNWQMTLIDNLDRALANRVCHLLIATHSHMLVSDLPMKRSAVTQIEKDGRGNLYATTIPDSTYGWSAEEVLLKVFKTATDRNRFFGERIGKLLEQMGNNTISPKEVKVELKELQEISMHLSDVDPMKMILNTIVETYE